MSVLLRQCLMRGFVSCHLRLVQYRWMQEGPRLIEMALEKLVDWVHPYYDQNLFSYAFVFH